MTPSDPIAALIPWYVNGTLAPDERRRVEEHLAACAECRGLLEDLRELSPLVRSGAGALEDHPHAQHLECYAADSAALERELAAWIRSHVGTCEACSEVLLILQQELERSATGARVAALPANRGRPVSFEGLRAERSTVPAFLSRTLLRPEMAAVYLLLLLAIPVFRALMPGPAPSPGATLPTSPRPMSPWGGAVELPVLSASHRGGTGTLVVTVEAGQPVVPIGVELGVPDLVPSSSVRFAVESASSAVEWSDDLPAERVVASMRGSGLVTLLIPAERLSEGRHRLVVRRLDRTDSRPLLEAPFEISRTP